MKNIFKVYLEEDNQPLFVYINTLSRGVLDVYSPTDGHTQATFSYIVSLTEASKSQAKQLVKKFTKLGVIE